MSYDSKTEYCTNDNCSYKSAKDVPGRPHGCCLRGCCEFGRKYLGWET